MENLNKLEGKCVRAIILAAGSSKRMGQNKLAIKLGEETILNKVINNVRSSRLEDVVVVYGAYEVGLEVSCDIPTIYNARHEEGMSTSIIAGLEGFNGDAVMLVLGDMPFVSSYIIDSIYEGFVNSEKNIAAPVFNGKRGNPVIIGKKYFKQLLDNKGDKGAREIIKNNPEDLELISVKDNGIFKDIDDENSLKLALGQIVG